jgi:hypothetical protein
MTASEPRVGVQSWLNHGRCPYADAGRYRLFARRRLCKPVQ